MKVSVAGAKKTLPKLIKAVENGETVTFCRRGLPAVDLVPATGPARKKPKLETLRDGIKIIEVIMRSFYSGRRFSCLVEVLLALFLIAPISLNAQIGFPGDDRPQLKRAASQTSGDSATQQTSAVGQAQPSSPQSQPAQSAASAPPPTQSEPQSAPPCSDARPILKRGTQPPLPPCPDPPPAASPPADSVPTRSLSPAESLIERAREAAFEFSEKLPDFICNEFMARFAQQGRAQEMPLDVVSAEIIYDHAQESYRNVKINDRPTDKGLQEIGGSWSTGEFASTLVQLFHPATAAQFRSGGASPISGFSAQVYDFQVRSENSHWRLQSGSQTLVAAYGGSVWVDPKTARVVRIEMQARNIPSDFPMDTVESAVDYSYVMIGGTSFLLPVHAESLGCERGTRYCSRNIIDFRNYHEYKVDFRIGP